MFQPILNTFTIPAALTDTIVEWESKELSKKKIKSPTTANHSLSPKFIWINSSKIRVGFKGGFVK